MAMDEAAKRRVRARRLLLLGKLGCSSQKPERQVKECDEAAIACWKQRTWPALRKSAARKAD